MKHQIEGAVHYAPLKSLWMTSMALAAVVGGAVTLSWACLLLFAAMTGMVLLFGATLGIHRKLIHDSFQCPRWLEYLMVYLGVQVGMCGPLGSARQHAMRDHAQNLPGCHAYLCHGGPIWLDAWWQIHCRFEVTGRAGCGVDRRIADDAFYRFLERTWILQQVPLALLLYLWGGWGFVFWGVAARITVAVGGYWLIAYLAHNHGAVRFKAGAAAVQSRNVGFASLLTMGECWHNNHHAFPYSARLGLYAGEWDPGWWVLSALRKCGLVWGVRLPPAGSQAVNGLPLTTTFS